MTVELIGSALAVLSPVYFLLFSMNSKMGTVKEKTERNEQDIQTIRSYVVPTPNDR